jgi:hypothetical protein
MTHPTSFRLSEDLLRCLAEEAASTGTSVAALVSTLLDEGLKTRRFPGIVYRDGPSGRRAGLAGGPDVWEIVRAVKESPGKGDRRLRALADEIGIPIARIRLAVDFYAESPAEIDARIAVDERAAARLRDAIGRREQLMSS